MTMSGTFGHTSSFKRQFLHLVATGVIVTWSWDVMFPAHASNFVEPGPVASTTLQAVSSPWAFVASAIFILPVLWSLFKGPSDRGSLAVRGTLFIAAAWLSWCLATESRNAYLDSWFFADRGFLVVSCLAILWTPNAVPIFLMASISYLAQFHGPFGWLYTYDIRPVYNVLLAGYAFFAVCRLRTDARVFFTTVLLMQLASYAFSGIGKIIISPDLVSWFTENELSLLLRSTEWRGWSPEVLSTLRDRSAVLMDEYPMPVAIAVFGLEVTCFIALIKRWAGLSLLVLLTCMHAVIFWLTGILFIHWMLINAGLVFVMALRPAWFAFRGALVGVFQSMVLVCIAILAFHPIFYAWHDARYQWTVDIVLVDGSGVRRTFDKNRMGGYSFFFTHGEFQRSIRRPILSNNGYSASLAEVRSVRGLAPAEVRTYLDAHGVVHFDADWTSRLGEFVQTYFTKIAHGPRSSSCSRFGPPRQLYMYEAAVEEIEAVQSADSVLLILREVYLAPSSSPVALDTTVLLRRPIDHQPSVPK